MNTLSYISKALLVLIIVSFVFTKTNAQMSPQMQEAVTKYKKLIDGATNPQDKIKYALILQNIITGKMAMDTSATSSLTY